MIDFEYINREEGDRKMTNEIIIAAQDKFGSVKSLGKHDTGDVVLLVRRSRPANAAFPYMTIRANNHRGSVAFHHGHYDMAEDEALNSFKERTAFSQQCF